MTDIKKVQEFIENKCGGESLQHILREIGKPLFSLSCVMGASAIQFDKDNITVFWLYFRNGKIADLYSQNAEDILNIAKLLGYKE